MLLTKTVVARSTTTVTNEAPRPQLTSLVDMLTILLVFLLKSFSVEGDLASAAPGLELAGSTSRERPTPMLNVVLSRTGVEIDGLQVVTIAEVAAVDSLMIPRLHRALGGSVEPIDPPEVEKEVTIQCDRRLEFAIVKKVMFTCAQAGYSDFSLLVSREG